MKVIVGLGLALTLLVAQHVHAMVPDGGPGGDAFPSGNNQWHLGYGMPGYSTDGTFQQLCGKQHGDQDINNPQEENELCTDNVDKLVLLSNPPTDCANDGPPQTNACTFTSHGARQEDDHNIRYDYRSWGGRCHFWIRALVYKPTVAWSWAALTPWSSGSPFIVVVPDGALTPTVFGKLNGGNIFFTPQNPLSAEDAKHFELLGSPQHVPGLGTIYRFRTLP